MESIDLSNHVERSEKECFAIGTYADIWMGKLTKESEDSQVVVLKTLRGGPLNPGFLEKFKQDLLREGAVWRNLQHENVAKLLGLAFNVGNMPSLVLPFYPSGNVMEYIKTENIDQGGRLQLIKGISSGIRYLHAHSPPVIHGDIRGENVLINENGCPVLVDYGLTFLIDTSTFTSAKEIGVCRWTAPELMDEEQSPYSLQSDMFAFAMTILQIYTEAPPFGRQKRDPAVIQLIVRGDRPNLPQYIKENHILSDIVRRCWAQESSQRPSAREVCDLLDAQTSSSWLRGWALSFYILATAVAYWLLVQGWLACVLVLL